MTLDNIWDYDYITELVYWANEKKAIFLEKLIEHALIELNAKDEDELVQIIVEGKHCIARVINEWSPIQILDEVIVFDIINETYTKDTVSIEKKISFTN